jgi:hypothetical protein
MQQQQETRLVGSDANNLGVEVTHVRRPHEAECLRAYQCGQLVATRAVDRTGGKAVGGDVDFAPGLASDRHSYVRLALDEGVRVLRDGQGLAAA